MLGLRDVQGGCELAVRAQPGARRTAIVGWVEGRLKLAVQAPALEGRANRAVVELVAETLDVAPSAVSVVRGESAREKTLRVAGRSAAEIAVLLPAPPSKE